MPGKKLDSVGNIVDMANKTIFALAILVGGGWTFWKYVVAESPTAQLEFDRVKRICAERGSLDIQINPTSVGQLIIGKVIVKNIGTREVILDMQKEPPIRVGELVLSANGDFRTSNVIKTGFPYITDADPNFSLTVFSILPGRTLELPFSVSVPRQGTYAISFAGGPRSVLPDEKVCGNDQKQELSYGWAAAAIQQVDAARR